MNATNDRLGQEQLATLKQALKERLGAVLEEIRSELRRSDNEHYQELAGSVHDIADESVADLLVDLDIQNIDRLVEQVRDIEAAQLRIASGSYGTCIDCGAPIGYERLTYYPTAKRCHHCQQHYEASHAGGRHASL